MINLQKNATDKKELELAQNMFLIFRIEDSDRQTQPKKY